MLTVHMIGNAHIDPVWLWRWPAGVGEALATCRTACDLLDEDPDLVFTRSDVWIYQQVEELDPVLFARVRRHAAAGRWAVVGGMYIQPDCNFPREESFRRHLASGERYFRERFGIRVTVGYNVDSFGHAASLPRILAEHGFDAYVMMRPKSHEKALPASLFRWRGTREAGGEGEVLTWRIAEAYCISDTDLSAHVRAAIAAAVPGVPHVMCFYGVGDHGGGPTRQQVAWIRAHQDSFAGARLIFSHPRAFFDAVKPAAGELPVVSGELQMHAVGCYSVGRSIKTAVRSAEHRLLMAETALSSLGGGEPPAPGGSAAALEKAWEKVLFNQFHDTYGGTVIPAAEADAVGQCASARDTAENVLYRALYRRAAALPAHPSQRLLAFNASDAAFDGCMEWEPWFGDWRKLEGWLADGEGKAVPFQVTVSPSLANMPGTLLWPARLAPGELRSWTIEPGQPTSALATDLGLQGSTITNTNWSLGPGRSGALVDIKTVLAAPGLSLTVQEDPSDTWSHGIDRYSGRTIGAFSVDGCHVEETGPVRASLRVDASFGRSSATLWAFLYREDRRLELRLRVDWREHLSVLKLVLPLATTAQRLDGIPGGGVWREQNGRESPVVDWTVVTRTDGGTLGIAMPDCSGLDGTPEHLALTLLRSPVYAWHDPARLPADRSLRWMEQGGHEFRFVLLPGADMAEVNRAALGMHRPPVCIDWTAGMGKPSGKPGGL